MNSDLLRQRTRGKTPDVFNDSTETKVVVSLGIFFVSLFAVSFPSLSKRIKYVRVPSIVFFLGKHFGTGVILSTAFVHLLPDAFEALDSQWTGLIILMSILAIFLVEYISTAYVDHLQSYASAPPSPTPSIRSRTHSVSSSSRTKDVSTPNHLETASEVTPLIPSRRPSVAEPETFVVQTEPADEIFAGSHHRHEPRGVHGSHSSTMRGKRLSAIVLFDEEGRLYGQSGVAHSVENGETDAGRPRRVDHSHGHSHEHTRSSSGHGHAHAHGHGHGHGHFHLGMDSWHADDEEEEVTEEVKIGRQRQVVGILMLQLGIMLHSLVIGLTLSITTGPEFTTLMTAIIFHQLFEGLSLGIRIAGLPSDSGHGVLSKIPGHILKPILATSFALTTPFGIATGLLAFSQGSKHDSEKVLSIQGFMSAASAGMLIYAACVEMLAGDFVMDPMMWRSGVRRQVLALLSLFLGVGAMALVGH